MFFIFGLLIQLAVIGGIVFAIVSAVRGRGRADQRTPGGAISIRRLFQYALLLAALLVAAFGVGGLLSRVISDAAARRGTELAGPLALTVVGVPVFWFLGRWIWQQLETDPVEQESAGWSFYINVALVGSFVTVVRTAFDESGDLGTRNCETVNEDTILNIAVVPGFGFPQFRIIKVHAVGEVEHDHDVSSFFGDGNDFD